MTVSQSIADANASAKKLFGSDISLVVARSPAFGNDDNLIIIMGKRHAEAAAWFRVAKRSARVTAHTGKDFHGKTYGYSEINF